MVVVDASAIVDGLLGAGDIIGRVLRSDVHAPVSIDAEVLHALRRKWIAKVVDDRDAATALTLFQTIMITRHPVTHLVERMWALRHNITGYDAGYVALAESLDVPLLTRDRRLSRSSSHTARIEYVT
jgi:predicted nucleic acid-binding protein